MKYILILMLLISSIFAEDKKQEITIGMGPYIQTQAYTNVDTIVLPSPVIFFDNGIFYIRWTRVGVYFLGEKNDDFSWGFSLTGQPRVYGYKSSDIIGMDERKPGLEAGIAFSAKKDKTYIEIALLTDVLNNTKSWILNTEIGHDIKLGDLSIYPSILVSYQSSEFTNYYYGITQKEATLKNIQIYVPNDGLQLGIQTYITYPITKKLSAFVNIKADKISSEASHSPIVNEKYIYSGLASLIYKFEY